jgi:hypothetical protein
MRGGRISRFDCVVCELLLGTDAVDMVVKATVARAGQVAIATENSIVEPAPRRDERGLVLFTIFGKGRNSMSKDGPVTPETLRESGHLGTAA